MITSSSITATFQVPCCVTARLEAEAGDFWLYVNSVSSPRSLKAVLTDLGMDYKVDYVEMEYAHLTSRVRLTPAETRKVLDGILLNMGMPS